VGPIPNPKPIQASTPLRPAAKGEFFKNISGELTDMNKHEQ